MKNQALEMDQADELAHFRSQFSFPEKDGKRCIYLCGNSLGLQPKKTKEFVENELNNWETKGIEGHFTGDRPWVSYHLNSKRFLSDLVGSGENEVIAMNNLTSNLHLALTTFYRPSGKRTKILIEKGAFPSDFYAVHSHIVLNKLNPETDLIELASKDSSDYLSTDDICAQIDELGDKLALVMLPGVQYYTGQFFDLNVIASAAHRVGAYAGFDLAHAVGNVPLTLHDDEVDFGVWCSYKYLNSGPGGVGGLFIHEKHGKNTRLPRMSGWWGHNFEVRFKMGNTIDPIPSVDGWQLSNINILSHAAHLASLELFDQAGIHKLHEKSRRLTGYVEKLISSSDLLTKHVNIITPSDPKERGCQLSLYLIKLGKSVFEHLGQTRVMLDWREPGIIRVAPVPLYNSFSDVSQFVTILENAIRREG